MPYEVTTPVYEGPFDLLLHLILQEEVELFEIRLAELVDAFLAQIEELTSGATPVDLESVTEFLLIAATLVELKARRLLPTPETVDLDEELLRFEARDLLLARLLECKTFKDVANDIERRIRLQARSLPRTAGPEEPFRSMVPDPLGAVSLDMLRDAAVRAFTPRPDPVVQLDHVAPIRISVAEAAGEVLAKLPTTGIPVNFRDLVHGIEGRIERIVHFLAVLELFKQGHVEIEQAATFGTLMVRRLDDSERDALDQAGFDDWEDGPSADADDDLDSIGADVPPALAAADAQYALDADTGTVIELDSQGPGIADDADHGDPAAVDRTDAMAHGTRDALPELKEVRP